VTVEDNKALVRRALTDLLNMGNMALVDELVAPGFVRHDLGGGPDIVGPHGRQAVRCGVPCRLPRYSDDRRGHHRRGRQGGCPLHCSAPNIYG